MVQGAAVVTAGGRRQAPGDPSTVVNVDHSQVFSFLLCYLCQANVAGTGCLAIVGLVYWSFVSLLQRENKSD